MWQHGDNVKMHEALILTLVLLNCLYLFLIHLKLELTTQFSARNDGKILLFMENRHLSNWKKWIAEHLSQTILSISVVFYSSLFFPPLLFPWSPIYTVPAAQGLHKRTDLFNTFQETSFIEYTLKSTAVWIFMRAKAPSSNCLLFKLSVRPYCSLPWQWRNCVFLIKTMHTRFSGNELRRMDLLCRAVK